MTEQPRRTAVPILVVAAICLFVGSAGGAVAGGLITGAQIKDETVTTADVKNKTLKTGDLSKAAKKSLEGPRGPAGPRGPRGEPGADGQVGYQKVLGTQATLGPGVSTSYETKCPASTEVLGGGFDTVGGASPTLVSGGPTGSGSPIVWGWEVFLANPTDAVSMEVIPFATCTRP